MRDYGYWGLAMFSQCSCADTREGKKPVLFLSLTSMQSAACSMVIHPQKPCNPGNKIS